MKLFLIISLFFLTACATSNFDASDTLKPNEGIAAFTFDCENVSNVAFYPVGTVFDGSYKERSLKSSALPYCVNSGDNEVKIIKMQEGTHFLGLYDTQLTMDPRGGFHMTRVHIAEGQAYKFHIKPQTINYIGNLKASYSPDFQDNYEEFTQKMSPENRAVVQKYKVVKAVAKK